jgi:hypothetical protein
MEGRKGHEVLARFCGVFLSGVTRHWSRSVQTEKGLKTLALCKERFFFAVFGGSAGCSRVFGERDRLGRRAVRPAPPFSARHHECFMRIIRLSL